MSRRGKERSGVFKHGDALLPSEEKRRSLVEAIIGFQAAGWAPATTATAEIESEIVATIEDIYRRHGLPVGTEARWRVFRRADGDLTWIGPLSDYEPGPDDDLAFWADIGAETFGRESEAGFASAMARQLEQFHRDDGRPVHRGEEWLAGMLAGYRLATSVWKWRWEHQPEYRAMVDPNAPEYRSRGGSSRARSVANKARARHDVWHEAAREYFSRHPNASVLEASRQLAKQGGELVNTIRQVIKKT